ncbi:hypothetical protein [Flavobacterium dankookense]|nr:hypothetical protein [Flavobacterium dankookense]
MYRAILKKYGDNFIDLTFENAKKEFVKENPKTELTEDGIKLSEKYK